jgi:hypothetical protein
MSVLFRLLSVKRQNRGGKALPKASKAPNQKIAGLRSKTKPVNLGRRLDPALKSWLDHVIIPALVREYMAEIKGQNGLAKPNCVEVLSK